MQNPIVQITGTGTSNKGAELLLIAIKKEFERKSPVFDLAVTANFGSYFDRARHGLRTVLPESPKGRWWLAGKLMPAGFRRSYGMVTESEVSTVIDASGFAFGDQLGAARVERFARDASRWRKQGKKIILLPQAFGPFTQPRIRKAFGTVANAVDLIFARDCQSYDYVNSIDGTERKLKLAPDITLLVDPIESSEITKNQLDALIIPNHRMIEKTGQKSTKYIPFLANCANMIRKAGLEPAILLHDTRIDKTLVDPIQQHLDAELNVIAEQCPIRLKSLCGSAKLVIGSRFHALLGSLSQGVPTIAAGWSHKYEELFSDFDCPENVIELSSQQKIIFDRITSIMDDWSDYNKKLLKIAAEKKTQVAEMWDTIKAYLA